MLPGPGPAFPGPGKTPALDLGHSAMKGVCFVVAILNLAPLAEAGSLIAELNRLRADPPAYAIKLEARRPYYRGPLFSPPGETPVHTNEGIRALDQAIRSLRVQLPLPPLADSSALGRSSLEHVRDIGPKGSVSHEGSNGSTP